MRIVNITNPDVEPVSGDMVRYEYDNGMTETKAYYPLIESVDNRTMKLVITSLNSDDPQQLVDNNEITCSVGSIITVNVEIHSITDDSLIEISPSFRLPILGPNGMIYTLVSFSSGIATVSTTLSLSGRWVVDEFNINAGIPNESDQFVLEESVVMYILQ